jgi:hypothetical protein
MASILKVDTIQDQSGNNIINENADTITIGASGDTVNIVGTLQNGGTNFLQGITEADQWRLTVDITTNTNPISANLERVDNTGFGKIGTGMSVSSGIWTFPSTGLWKIELHATGSLGGSDVQTTINIRTYISASPTDVAIAYIGSNGDNDSASTSFLYNVTDTSTHQLTFRTDSMVSSTVRGDTDYNETHFNFIRLGDSV